MKIGFNMLLWTTHVTDEHLPTIERIKAAGYDGVEIPIFDGEPAFYADLGRKLDDLGVGRTALTVIPSPDMNPISADAADRQRGDDYLRRIVDCTAALGAEVVCGPLHQSLGVFSGHAATFEEFERARAFHRRIGDYARDRGVTLAVEALNRFECYLINTMETLSAHLEEVDHPAIRGMYDSFHANIEEKDPAASLARALRHVAHVHVCENDRGTPGTGHCDLAGAFRVLKAGGYEGWLTIEAFGRSLPELAAATRVWRDFAPSPDEIWQQGYVTIRDGWAAA